MTALFAQIVVPLVVAMLNAGVALWTARAARRPVAEQRHAVAVLLTGPAPTVSTTSRRCDRVHTRRRLSRR